VFASDADWLANDLKALNEGRRGVPNDLEGFPKDGKRLAKLVSRFPKLVSADGVTADACASEPASFNDVRSPRRKRRTEAGSVTSARRRMRPPQPVRRSRSSA
jgi:hypothetical protein